MRRAAQNEPQERVDEAVYEELAALMRNPTGSQAGDETPNCSGISRRVFLAKSGLILGAVATGAASLPADEKGTSKAAPPSEPNQHQCALAPDGKLVETDGSKIVAPDRVASQANARQGAPGRKWVMAVDLSACDGCGHCIQACSKMHGVPPNRQWIKVLVMKDAELTAPYYFPQPCFQCDNPPCTKVCPVDATYKRNDGVVLIDNDRCIGCRYCMAACPYGARSFNWGPPKEAGKMAAAPYSPEWGYPRRVGTVEKCDFCPDMAARGVLPACVEACPMKALYYGDQKEDAVTRNGGDTFKLSKLLRDRAAYRHLEELGTEPRVYYLPVVNRAHPAPGEGAQPGQKGSGS